ncbi:amidohydrolase [Gordonibacter sp. 28C]|uniref:amidohydrolase family protein n=1 Tax=Gordonibacter sp. 28C TaxID=2078569 RepID=UPI000DF7DF79|nr:amidohydrolase family protein [Gordonibacter sp. 28C]RDB60379.1 amidohydrolase [Gordonibacter sp. 28C]
MYGKIGLEEHFAIPDTLGGSLVYFTGEQDLRTTRLLDLLDLRIQQMDENGMDMMILSLNSPAIQSICDPQRAAELSRKANEELADAITKEPDRFRGFAALPLQDPDLAIEELHYAIDELGFVGVLANGYSQIGSEDNYLYLDDPLYRPFWAEMEKMDVPFYLHPREPMPCNAHTLDGHYWIHGAPWAFGVETATHTLRLMCSGLFDEYPKLRIVLGHLGEGLPFLIWRAQNHLNKRRRGMPAQKPLPEYLNENVWVTTSGQFTLPPLVCTMMQMGADRIMFATDYPFEEVSDACVWFDGLQISETDKKKIARDTANEFFKLGL